MFCLVLCLVLSCVLSCPILTFSVIGSCVRTPSVSFDSDLFPTYKVSPLGSPLPTPIPSPLPSRQLSSFSRCLGCLGCYKLDTHFIPPLVSRFGLAERRLADNRKGLGSIPLQLSFLFRKVVVCGHCPVTLSITSY